LYVLTTLVTVCVCHAEINGYLLIAGLTTTVIIDALLRFSHSSNPRLSNLAQIYLSVSQKYTRKITHSDICCM